MADFRHEIRLTPEEVQQAVLDLALARAKARGLTVDAHSFHTKAAVVLDATGAAITWRDE